MATREQVASLLAVPCPHCKAGRGEPCGVAAGPRPLDTEGGKRRQERRPITSLDGGCHDARWQAALGVPAQVITEALQETQHRAVGADEPAAGAQPVSVGTALAERPW